MPVTLDASAVDDVAAEPVESADTSWTEIEGGEAQTITATATFTPDPPAEAEEAAETPPTQEEAVENSPSLMEAMDEFRQRMRDAADELACATLGRMAAEQAVKDAKGEEKVAAQAFEKLRLEVGREYPLIDALESQKTAEANLADTPADGVEDTSAESTDNSPAETPTVVIDKVHWAKAPIAMLKLPKGAEKALVEKNEITTVGQLAEYIEGNGTVGGLEGVPKDSTRAKKIEEKFHAFIESQK